MAYPAFATASAAVRLAAAAGLCAGLTLWSGPSAAAGAMAVGIPPNVAVSGFAEGHANNKSTVDEASAVALEECRKEGRGINPPIDGLCVVTSTYQDKCVSVAFDPKPGTPGVGWAIAPTSAESNAQAMANCVATAGADRRGYCALGNGGCDGTAR